MNVVGKVTLVPALATVPLGVFVNPGGAERMKEYFIKAWFTRGKKLQINFLSLNCFPWSHSLQ